MNKEKEIELKEAQEYKLTLQPLNKEKDKEHYAKLSLNPELKEKIAKIIMDEVEGAESNEERQAFIEHCDYCRARYTMEDLDNPIWEGAAVRRTGGTTIAVDRLMPRERQAIFGSGHIVQVSPEGTNTDENAQHQEKWLDSVMRNDMKLEEVFGGNVMYDADMLNFGIFKNVWVFEEDKREEVVTYESADELLRNHPDAFKRYSKLILKLTGYETLEELARDYPNYQKLPQAMDDDGLPVKVVVRETYRDNFSGMRPEWVDPKDIIFPKGVVDEEKSWIIIQHLRMRRDELLRAKENKAGLSFDFNEEEFFGKDWKDDDDYGKELDVYEAILRYDIDDDGLEERCVYWVAKGDSGKQNIFLRGIKFPYTHNHNYLILVRSTEHRYGFYTGGLGAKLRAVNESEDRRVNQISNAWDQAIGKVYLHVKSFNSPFNPHIHKMYPTAILPVASKEELTEMVKGDIPNSSFSLLDDNRRESELISGITSGLMSGQITSKDPNAPAKKSELLLAESNISISAYIKMIIPAVKEIAYQTQMNYYQFTDETEEKDFRIERGFEHITKEQMRGKLAFSCHAALESVNAQAKAQANVALLNVLGQNPLAARNYSFMWVLIKSIVENWSEDLARHIDELFSPELKNLIVSQLKEADALAQQKAQQEEYIKKRKSEGASSEIINMEMKQQSGQQPQGGQGGQGGAQ